VLITDSSAEGEGQQTSKAMVKKASPVVAYSHKIYSSVDTLSYIHSTSCVAGLNKFHNQN